MIPHLENTFEEYMQDKHFTQYRHPSKQIKLHPEIEKFWKTERKEATFGWFCHYLFKEKLGFEILLRLAAEMYGTGMTFSFTKVTDKIAECYYDFDNNKFTEEFYLLLAELKI
jgi:hypothetical protein